MAVGVLIGVFGAAMGARETVDRAMVAKIKEDRNAYDRYLAGDANKAARDKLYAYFNIDPGTGPIYGYYLVGSDAIKPIFDAWLEPFRDLGGERT